VKTVCGRPDAGRTAVEAGSLSAASRRLGEPLASRRLTLTDAGRSYVAACKRMLKDVEEADRAASGEYSAPKGDLIITAPIVWAVCTSSRW
jgi:DNA-binding transcriptional LysR family regulator